MGFVHMSHTFQQPERIRGLHESSAKTKIVYMKHSLCLSSQLSRGLGDYMVGTTVGFQATTMEALTPWPHIRISQCYLYCHMSTYFASHRVNSPGHPLDRTLGGYYRGLVPLVPWATYYGPTNLDSTQFLPIAND
jgi:hypothetical protein